MHSDVGIREAFHFFFLESLLRISDPKIFVLKGGVNLRFFFNSPRYSEDMDIDVLGGAVGTLKKNVYKILEDKSFRRKLLSFGIQDLILNDPSKAKQTDTTQRFKLSLVSNNGDLLPTKIEFSRRTKNTKFFGLTERVSQELARKYFSLAFLVNHYDGQSALVQKIDALAGRKQVEVRDAFDIFILDLGGFCLKPNSNSLNRKTLKAAQEAVLSINYKEYLAKVVEFLVAKEQEKYYSKEAWQEIQAKVLELITI